VDRRNVFATAALAAGLFAACARVVEPPAPPAGKDPEAWAKPVRKAGLPNFHKVSDALHRGAQPTAEGMRELKSLGVRTVVNLRSFHSDRDELKGLDLRYEHIYMKAWHPEREEVVRFLKIVADPRNRPVFVHCQHGADRTGLMCAIYRVAFQGWTKEEAAAEMKDGGFGHHVVWKNLIDYLEELDVDAVKREAGIAGTPHAEALRAAPKK